ncbi:acyl carrier protein [Catenulispora sp. GAS73]|uniref:phosphopantetheine-binding protein n=1 Tax=Catenulispora sp. GAS73 TaxID=3156269 RepID=UPI0035199974
MNTEYANVTDRTAALTTIWRDVLKMDDIDETSDLFDVGGTSIHVLEIVGRVYDVLGLDLRLRQIFEHASPQSLSAFIGEQGA